MLDIGIKLRPSSPSFIYAKKAKSGSGHGVWILLLLTVYTTEHILTKVKMVWQFELLSYMLKENESALDFITLIIDRNVQYFIIIIRTINSKLFYFLLTNHYKYKYASLIYILRKPH